MHQRNQNKKLFDMYGGKLSLTTAANGNQRKSIFLGYGLKKLPKNNFLCLYPRTPNFTPTDQIW